jgi:hypothetical protein
MVLAAHSNPDGSSSAAFQLERVTMKENSQ